MRMLFSLILISKNKLFSPRSWLFGSDPFFKYTLSLLLHRIDIHCYVCVTLILSFGLRLGHYAYLIQLLPRVLANELWGFRHQFLLSPPDFHEGLLFGRSDVSMDHLLELPGNDLDVLKWIKLRLSIILQFWEFIPPKNFIYFLLIVFHIFNIVLNFSLFFLWGPFLFLKLKRWWRWL